MLEGSKQKDIIMGLGRDVAEEVRERAVFGTAKIVCERR